MNFYEFVFWTELITVIACLIIRKLWIMCVGSALINIAMWIAEFIIMGNESLAADDLTRLVILIAITAVLVGNIIYAVQDRKHRENNTQNLK